MATKKQTETVDHAARLRDVLAAMGITRGTFVDDQFSLKFDDAWARSRAAVGSKSSELASAWGVGRWETDSAEDDRPAAEKAWNVRPNAEQVELTNAISALTAGLVPADEVPSDVGFFSEFWPSETCPLEELGPEAFDAPYIRNSLLGEGPSILFVDLSFGDGDERGGIRLLKEVLSADKNRTTVCVVFTRQPGAEAADFWADMATAEGIDSGAAVAISKSSTDSIAVFEVDLRRALLNGLAPELVTWAKEIANKALTKAVSNTKIEGDVLNAVVLQSSEKEGVHPTETLFRLIDEDFRRERDSMVASDAARQGFASLKTKLEALAKIAPKDDVDPPLTSRVRKLMRRHLYRTQEGTAEWAAPIWLGDLWEVSFEEGTRDPVEQFVLIAQPCDIILRAENGDRTQEWAILVPLRKDKGNHPEMVVELKYFDEAKYDHRYAYLKRARVANANVLDLVATIGPVIEKSEIAQLRTRAHVHASVEKRTVHLADWLAKIPVESNAAAQTLALFAGPGPVAKLSNTADKIDFHCKRIGRIEPELARLVLQRYGNFVARHALPHDFADYEK